jgi:hypothetical protein
MRNFIIIISIDLFFLRDLCRDEKKRREQQQEGKKEGRRRKKKINVCNDALRTTILPFFPPPPFGSRLHFPPLSSSERWPSKQGGTCRLLLLQQKQRTRDQDNRYIRSQGCRMDQKDQTFSSCPGVVYWFVHEQLNYRRLKSVF